MKKIVTLLLFIVLSMLFAFGQDTAKPVQGEGIYSFLKRNNRPGKEYEQKFIELNKDKLGKNQSLKLGVSYKLPPLAKPGADSEDITQLVVILWELKEMNKAAESSGVVFGMMFNQRTDHIYRKMREITQSGSLGAIRRVNWTVTNWYRSQFYYDSGAWRATWSGEGGGVLLNQCPHNLDLWQWICGMPSKVHAKLHFGKWHDIEVEDDVSAYVEYPNGATGTFTTTTGDAPGSNRFEITYEKGKLVAEDGKLILWELDKTIDEFSRDNKEVFGTPSATMKEIETDGKHEGHNGVLNAFAGAVLRGEPLTADGLEGINGLTISNAMHLSAWLDKEIEIPFDENLFYDELMKRVATSRRKVNVNEVVAGTEGSY